MRIRTRLAIYITLLLALTLGVGGSLLISASFGASIDNETSALLDNCELMMSTIGYISQLGDDGDNSNLAGALEQFKSSSGRMKSLRLYVGNETVYDSDEFGLISHSEASTQSGKCEAKLLSHGDSRYYQVSGTFMSNDVLFTIASVYDVTYIYTARQTQTRIYRYVFLCVLGVGAAAAFGISALVTAPIERLSRTTRQIASGEFDTRAQINGSDEVSMLASDFNSMTDRLVTNIDQLKESMLRQEEFIGFFAHEMKTPMTAIIGYADLMRTMSLDAEEQREAANYIFSEGRRLENLSFKLLDLLMLRQGDFSLSMCSPEKLVSDVVNALKPSMHKQNIVLQCNCQSGMCMLEPDLIKSLIINLIDNARKAFDTGGNIYIRSAMTDEGCRITVLDNGRGIPKDDLNRLTEAFYRVDKSRSRRQGGAGLGLALCAEIVRVHNGSINFSSELGKGTCVTVELKGDIQ